MALILMQLMKLINDRNVYFEKINGKLSLSIKTGLIVQDLISNCGCSVEKMSLMIELVLQMLFGDIDKDSLKQIAKAPVTYSRASERTAVIIRSVSTSRFLIRNNELSILNAYLIMDATNKGNKSLVAKLFNYISYDGVVRLGSFTMDNTGEFHFHVNNFYLIILLIFVFILYFIRFFIIHCFYSS